MIKKSDPIKDYGVDSVEWFLNYIVELSSQDVLNQKEIITGDIKYLNRILTICRAIPDLDTVATKTLNELKKFIGILDKNRFVQGILSGISEVSKGDFLPDFSNSFNPVVVTENQAYRLKKDHNTEFLLGGNFRGLRSQKATDGVRYLLDKCQNAQNPINVEWIFNGGDESTVEGFYPSLKENLIYSGIRNVDIPQAEYYKNMAAKRVVGAFKNEFGNIDAEALDDMQERVNIYNRLKTFLFDNNIPPEPFRQYELEIDIDRIIDILKSWDISNEVEDKLNIARNSVIGHVLYRYINHKFRYLGNTDYSLKELILMSEMDNIELEMKGLKSRIFSQIKQIIKTLEMQKPTNIPKDVKGDLLGFISKIKNNSFLMENHSALVGKLEKLSDI